MYKLRASSAHTIDALPVVLLYSSLHYRYCLPRRAVFQVLRPYRPVQEHNDNRAARKV